MFEKISKKIGFTETEIIVILFLTVMFLIGFFYIEFIKNGNTEELEFDYSEQDSLFEYYSKTDYLNIDANLSTDLSQEIKKEVLELPDSIAYVKKDLSSLKERSIDINSAGLSEWITLPGIGEKTAEKIIELRTAKGQFGRLEELMEVKGIGEVKFNKIKKFLYIK